MCCHWADTKNLDIYRHCHRSYTEGLSHSIAVDASSGLPVVFVARSNMRSGPHCAFRYAQTCRRWYQVALRLCSPFQGAKSFSFTQHWSYIENPKNHIRRTTKNVSGEFRKVVSWKSCEDKKSSCNRQSKPPMGLSGAKLFIILFGLTATIASCCFLLQQTILIFHIRI